MRHFKLLKRITRCLLAINGIDTLISPPSGGAQVRMTLRSSLSLPVRGVGRASAKWYLENVAARGRAGSSLPPYAQVPGLRGGNTCQPLSPWPQQAGEAFSQAPQMNGH